MIRSSTEKSLNRSDLDSQASFTTKGSRLTDEERIRRTSIAAREYEAKKDRMTDFDPAILKERLQLSTPLQKLYEKMYFDKWSPIEDLRKFDNF